MTTLFVFALIISGFLTAYASHNQTPPMTPNTEFLASTLADMPSIAVTNEISRFTSTSTSNPQLLDAVMQNRLRLDPEAHPLPPAPKMIDRSERTIPPVTVPPGYHSASTGSSGMKRALDLYNAGSFPLASSSSSSSSSSTPSSASTFQSFRFETLTFSNLQTYPVAPVVPPIRPNQTDSRFNNAAVTQQSSISLLPTGQSNQVDSNPSMQPNQVGPNSSQTQPILAQVSQMSLMQPLQHQQQLNIHTGLNSNQVSIPPQQQQQQQQQQSQGQNLAAESSEQSKIQVRVDAQGVVHFTSKLNKPEWLPLNENWFDGVKMYSIPECVLEAKLPPGSAAYQMPAHERVLLKMMLSSVYRKFTSARYPYHLPIEYGFLNALILVLYSKTEKKTPPKIFNPARISFPKPQLIISIFELALSHKKQQSSSISEEMTFIHDIMFQCLLMLKSPDPPFDGLPAYLDEDDSSMHLVWSFYNTLSTSQNALMRSLFSQLIKFECCLWTVHEALLRHLLFAHFQVEFPSPLPSNISLEWSLSAIQDMIRFMEKAMLSGQVTRSDFDHLTGATHNADYRRIDIFEYLRAARCPSPRYGPELMLCKFMSTYMKFTERARQTPYVVMTDARATESITCAESYVLWQLAKNLGLEYAILFNPLQWEEGKNMDSWENSTKILETAIAEINKKRGLTAPAPNVSADLRTRYIQAHATIIQLVGAPDLLRALSNAWQILTKTS